MELKRLFGEALGLEAPWRVTKIEFTPEKRRIDIIIDFPPGSQFPCPECGAVGAKAYDTSWEEWRHLDFFQYAAYLHARVPRVQCPQGCGVKKVPVPWARRGSGFTLLFEALIMALVREMPVAAVAKLIGEHDTKLWRVLHHYVEEARAKVDFSQVRKVGVDEKASRRGHNYISLFFDLEAKRLVFGTEGRGAETVGQFVRDLEAHGGSATAVREVCCDMSPAFIAGVRRYLPEAEITFDRFHIMKVMNEAVDEVRREEAKETGILKRTRYLWLKNPVKLGMDQKRKLEELKRHHLKTARAYQIKLTLAELFEQPSREEGERFLKRWYFWATHSQLKPVVEAARTIKRHWEGILNWFESKLTIGLLEGVNSLLQAAKARARGYRSVRNLIAMAYLLAGKLNFGLPT